jgi:hypothetical protein
VLDPERPIREETATRTQYSEHSVAIFAIALSRLRGEFGFPLQLCNYDISVKPGLTLHPEKLGRLVIRSRPSPVSSRWRA